jgi:hypothetical protein
MTMSIQIEHIQRSTTGIPGAHFESIDSCLLSVVIGGKGPNFLQRWGENMQKGGEYALATGAVGTAIPGLGETGIPEGVAAGGGASWLLGKGVKALGGLF